MKISLALELGRTSPYDWTGFGPIRKQHDWSYVAARSVVADLTDRRGMKWGFGEVQEEIIDTLAEIVRQTNDEGA